VVVHDHFSNHFKYSNMERPRVEDLNFKVLRGFEGSNLIKPFSEEEVKCAVRECASFKSLSSNCANFGFVKDFWTEIKSDVLRFLLEFHRNGKFTKGVNYTFIVLILKVENPQRLNEFRLISLVGCLYKILARVVANLIRCVTRSVISDT
jgi:hypothetical protein